MCTVTFIPTHNGFQLTSNRDENISRGRALAPALYDDLLFPKDPDKKGSWIIAKNTGDVAVLLNGAFVKHERQPGYRKSRGLVLLDVMQAKHPAHCYNEMNLSDIEPFTMVLYTGGNLYECRWDGIKKHIARLSDKMAHIWSSATLYDSKAKTKREHWFSAWKKSGDIKTVENILAFHRNGGEGDETDGLVINRDGIMKTVSITSVQVNPAGTKMSYYDLQSETQHVKELQLADTGDAHNVKPPRFLKLRAFFIKLFNWEYWSFNIVYLPVMYYWFWLSLKSRSLFFFSPSNPLIENGGFAMESKKLIYDLIPQKYYPKTLSFKAGAQSGEIRQALVHEPLSYPFIAKPDIGGRGVQVKLVHDDNELKNYVGQIKVDFLLQEYVPYKNEVGIFYYRLPGEQKGHITGLVGKEFLKITGDGRSTIQTLLIKEPRYLLQLAALTNTEGRRLQEVLPAGESLTLVPYGNHARGARFIDLSHLITPQLTETFDAVCQQVPEFYFGRLDVMYNTWDELCRGENFSIIELNGAASEPAHIYDSNHSIFYAWKEIMRHWSILYQVSKLNNQHKGIAYMTYKEGVEMLKRNSAYNKLVA